MVSTLLSALNVIFISILNDVCFQLLPISSACTVGINNGEETASRMEYDGSGCTPADCTNSAQIAMDNGYTISVKTEDETPETLQYGRPIHWTVDDRGVLVNADESEVVVKGEKPDWTTETETADCSTIMAGQGEGGTQDAVLFDFVNDEDIFY